MKKVLYKVKARGQHHSFNIFWWFLTWAYNKYKVYEFSDWMHRSAQF